MNIVLHKLNDWQDYLHVILTTHISVSTSSLEPVAVHRPESHLPQHLRIKEKKPRSPNNFENLLFNHTRLHPNIHPDILRYDQVG